MRRAAAPLRLVEEDKRPGEVRHGRLLQSLAVPATREQALLSTTFTNGPTFRELYLFHHPT